MTDPVAGRELLVRDVLDIDAEAVTAEIVDALRRLVGQELRRRGAVVAVSGGIDSAVTAALCVRAVGAERTLGVSMPEADSAGDTANLSTLVVESLGIESVLTTSHRSSARPAATSAGTRPSARSSPRTGPAGGSRSSCRAC